jgi:DNA modification methylase
VTGEVAVGAIQRRPQSADHPAVFSTAIIDKIVELLDGTGVTRILDPFAGIGRVHDIADRLGISSIGVEHIYLFTKPD